MRPIALLFFIGSVVACAGQVESSNQNDSKQQAGSSAEEGSRSEQSSGQQTGSGSSTPQQAAPPSNGDSEYPAPTWGSKNGCYLDPGPAAAGECEVGKERECPDTIERGTTSGGPSGCRQKCVNVSGTARWSEPTMDTIYCPYQDTNLFIGADKQECQCNTPLVLSFDNAHVAFDTEATGSFDLTRKGMSHGGDWPTAATPWLALDRDGNGSIDDGGELFGSATRLANGGFARNGFDALRDLDDNHDGVFDARDAAYAKVVVWSDRNRDRKSTRDELTSLAVAGVTSIDLHDRREVRCDERMNCEGERSAMTLMDGHGGTVIDVYIPLR